MANRYRGEVSAVLSGRPYTLCLTLGALAELEDALAVGDVATLAERFGTGRLSARDLVAILGAGLRGAGHEVSDDEVAQMRIDGGASGFATLAVDLLSATFGGPDEVSETPPDP